jgi:hypothetical protein
MSTVPGKNIFRGPSTIVRVSRRLRLTLQRRKSDGVAEPHLSMVDAASGLAMRKDFRFTRPWPALQVRVFGGLAPARSTCESSTFRTTEQGCEFASQRRTSGRARSSRINGGGFEIYVRLLPTENTRLSEVTFRPLAAICHEYAMGLCVFNTLETRTAVRRTVAGIKPGYKPPNFASN